MLTQQEPDRPEFRYNTIDARRATRAERFVFQQVRKAEVMYAQRLRGLSYRVVSMARQILQEMGANVTPDILVNLAELLNKYGDAITPWAKVVAQRMVYDVALRDSRAWIERSKNIAWGIQAELENAPIAALMQQRVDAQIALITSIPRNVAQQVHAMATETLYTGARFKDVSAQIMQIADITQGRANLIARTEVASATTELTRARAEHIGSEGYIWRTVGDEDVRPSLFLAPKTFAKLNTKARGSHRLLEGTFHRWDEPPIANADGTRAHPGQTFYCRCIPEVVVPGYPPDNQSWSWAQKYW